MATGQEARKYVYTFIWFASYISQLLADFSLLPFFFCSNPLWMDRGSDRIGRSEYRQSAGAHANDTVNRACCIPYPAISFALILPQQTSPSTLECREKSWLTVRLKNSRSHDPLWLPADIKPKKCGLLAVAAISLVFSRYDPPQTDSSRRRPIGFTFPFPPQYLKRLGPKDSIKDRSSGKYRKIA